MYKASFWAIIFVMACCGTMTQAAIINVDFGSQYPAALPFGWNNIGYVQAKTVGYLREDMRDSTDAVTPVGLKIEDGFTSAATRNGSGGTTLSTAFSPGSADATKYNCYIFEGDADHSVAIRIEGLVVGETYKFGFFDSYISDGAARRECKYIIGDQSVNLVPNYNVNNVAYLQGISPDNNGTVLITLGFGAAPEVLNKVCGLAVMTIEGNFIPEPASMIILSLGFLGLLKRRVH